ncbi:hypothetical protein [Reyranella sp.]|jgi:uncharacterized membrane protein YbaN (DUF454 family)|uniref:hypothetical protein n=1 Tax=Reyranella sp. TaxID=1929291 RepID=UPI002F930D7C
MRKPLMALAIAACLAMAVIGGLLPILQGWIFFVLALYLFATEFETGRSYVKVARRRWPVLSRWIVKARSHRWAPRHLQEFDDLTDPSK